MRYNHDYHSHLVPMPVIKDVTSAIEDVAGNLTTTHTLQDQIMNQIEGLTDIAKQMEDAPDSIDPDAWKYRLKAMWGIADAIDARMKNDIILLYAVVEQGGDELTPAFPPPHIYTGFAGEALTMVHMVERSDGRVSDDRMNELVAMASKEIDALLPKVPQTIEDLERKIEAIAIMFKDCRWSDEAWVAVHRDIKALTA